MSTIRIRQAGTFKIPKIINSESRLRPSMHIDDFEIARLPRNQKAYEWYDVAARPDGGQWRLPVCTITSAQPGPTFVVIAGIHGDEYEGPETIANVYQKLTPAQLTT